MEIYKTRENEPKILSGGASGTLVQTENLRAHTEEAPTNPITFFILKADTILRAEIINAKLCNICIWLQENNTERRKKFLVKSKTIQT